MEKKRRTGILLHITSLPSEYGVGDLGDNAYRFADALADNGVTLWQMLPLGPTGYGDSPYAARSAFAGNELLISPRQLYKEGFLEIEDVMKKAKASERVDYGAAKLLKMPMLRKAAEALLSSSGEDKDAYEAFRSKEGWWLEDYALFQALIDRYNDSRWFMAWPEELRDRKPEAINKAREELSSLL